MTAVLVIAVVGYGMLLSASLTLPKSDDHPPLLIYGAPRSEDHVLAEHLSGIFPTRVLRIVAATDAPGKSGFRDAKGDVARIYDMRPGTTYLFRPDQHVLARWRQCNANAVEAALRAVTLNAARQNFEEDTKGSLARGKDAQEDAETLLASCGELEGLMEQSWFDTSPVSMRLYRRQLIMKK